MLRRTTPPRTPAARALTAGAAVVAMVASLLALSAAPASAQASPTLTLDVNGPTGPVSVGQRFTVDFRPTLVDGEPFSEFSDVAVTFDAPAGVEVHNTYGSDGNGNDRSCENTSGRTWTCPGQFWVFPPWSITFIATEASPAIDIDFTASAPTTGAAPVTESTTFAVGTSVTNAAVASNFSGETFTVGEPAQLTLTLYNTGPVAAVGTELTFELPASFVVDPDATITTAWFDPEVEGWSSGTCSVAGTTVTCEDVNLYSTTSADPYVGGYRFVGVTATPTAPGSVTLSAALAPGPDQSEPVPDPTSNSWSESFTVLPATNGSIVGTVTGTSGAPVGGVTVDAFSPTDTTTPTASVVSDGAGQYVLSSLPPSDYDLRYTAPGPSGYAVQWFGNGGVASDRANAVSVIVPGTGAVVPASQQLQDLDVSHVDLGGGSWDPSEPMFAIAGETVQLEISPGYRQWFVDGVRSAWPADSEFTITVPTSVEIESAVQDRGAGGGSPVGTCSVTAHEAVCDLPDPLLTVLLDVTPSESGSVAVAMTHTSPVTEASPDGLPATSTQMLEVLANTGTISGVVTDAVDVPVEGAWVLAYRPSDGFFPSQAGAWAVTGPDGSYSLSGLVPDGYRVVVVPPSGSDLFAEWYDDAAGRATATSVEVWASGSITGIDVSLASATSISGTVSSSGGPVAGARVIAYSPTDRYAGSREAVAAADGTYSITGLAPDTYRVRVAPPSGSGLSGEWYDDAATRSAATPIAVGSSPVTGIDTTLD